MTKHTPGPFKAFGAIEIENGGETKRWSVVHAGDRPWLIAEIQNGAPGDTCATEEANARLFAAAPDLLDELKKAEAYIRARVTNPDRGQAGRALLPGLAAAIAKAEVSE